MAIGPDTMPPVTRAASLTMAENAAATAIGMAAPTDPNYTGSQLSVTATGCRPTAWCWCRMGSPPSPTGEILTIAQLTGLMFKPAAGIFGQSSTFIILPRS